MISGLWGQTHLCCGCDHTERTEMIVHEAGESVIAGGVNSVFYSCPKYYPDNRKEGETACVNRLSLSEYEDMINTLSDKIEKSEQEGAIINLQGFSWKNKKGTEFTVLEHGMQGIYISVRNIRALR